jgi:uncharacterized protein (TIGR03790 family)
LNRQAFSIAFHGCWCITSVVATLLISVRTTAVAGGGPENVFLLVNSSSESSKAIANHYIDLRKIPACNVLYLDWRGGFGIVPGDQVRDNIIGPALKAIAERNLARQIDYLVYSSDFPWRAELNPAFPGKKFPSPFDAFSSLTGFTYLSRYAFEQDEHIAAPISNWYVPGPRGKNETACQDLANVPSRGFRSRYLWEPSGNRANSPATGQNYVLSAMLGVTVGRGNTVNEIISYLKSAAAADGTKPRGTIYFMWNKDVRSSARDKCFASMAQEINRLGVRAQVMQGRVPNGAKDVMGLMAGTEDFDLDTSQITILPGAICEHLTSCGGIMMANGGQTPLSEFLRHGAAGASGTVCEPYNIQAKFPLPSLHLHYVRGCSLAESFFQSVSAPYQLLVVGDPLCQPWADIPTISVKGVKAWQKVSGTLSIVPTGEAKGAHAIGAYDFFVDGRLVSRSPPGKAVELDTSKLPDGYHELRVVGVLSDPIETQGRQVLPILVSNHEAALEMNVSPRQRVNYSEKLSVQVRHPGATAIVLRQNSREVGRVKGESGTIDVPASTLGRGPSTLQAFSEGGVTASSSPVRFQVD